MRFSDNESQIDLVLAYTENDQEDEEDKDDADQDHQTRRERRECFERNLEKQGLLLEREPASVRRST